MAKVSIRISNESAIMNFLDQFPKEIEQEINSVMKTTIEDIALDAKNNVAIDTGSLQASIKTGSNVDNTYFVSAGGNEFRNTRTNKLLIYAPYVEFGTGNNFNIPSYNLEAFPNLSNYASLFKRSGNSVNQRSRSFLFNAAAYRVSDMIKRLLT